MRGLLTITTLAGALALAGCAELAEMRPAQPRPVVAVHPAPPPPSPLAPAQPLAMQRSASAAEAACVAQGQGQGMNIQRVVGTREVAGPGGQPVARDVMLRVARGQQVFDIRCSYDYASGQARIMTL